MHRLYYDSERKKEYTHNNKTTQQKRTMVNKTKQYTPEDIVCYNHTKHKGIVGYYKPSTLRAVCGMTCIGIGAVTLPLPTGSIFLIGFGSYLLGYDSKKFILSAVHRAKCVKDWVYCNRTPTKLKRTIKTMVLGW